MNSSHKQVDRRQCIRCGTCCKKGGPSLHMGDKSLLKNGHIHYSDLITIRKGESAYSPISGKVEPVRQELVKLAGKDREWTCRFFNDSGNGSLCELYKHRPLECRLLKCWNPQELIDVIGKDTISRYDLIKSDDPLMEIIPLHDQECSFLEVEELLTVLAEKPEIDGTMARLTGLVRKDLAIRSHTVARFNMPVAVEFFILGRPLFSQLEQRGIEIREYNGDVHLKLSTT